jgi:hypothetical protein
MSRGGVERTGPAGWNRPLGRTFGLMRWLDLRPVGCRCAATRFAIGGLSHLQDAAVGGPFCRPGTGSHARRGADLPQRGNDVMGYLRAVRWSGASVPEPPE